MAQVELKNVNKSFGPVHVIKDVDLEINKGEFVVFVGPSGCGKSTLLRLIAGLETLTSGEIVIADRPVMDLPPSERGIAMVFQSYALYPHMTVFHNMAFSLSLQGLPKSEIQERVEVAAKILQMEHLLDRRPAALSGGQRQRVAIGRAIVRNPEVFLFDEPLSNLDAALRHDTRVEIAKLHNQLGATTIYVTHDQVEAMTLADKIVVLKDGVVMQVGAPMDLFNDPGNEFVASFLGSPKMNFFGGKLTGLSESGETAGFEGVGISVDAVRLVSSNKKAGDEARLGIRPQHLRLDDNGQLKGK
ncbi:MAG: ATP-binding cassette domain-containing protein, partial [Rhodobacteraceae bacterium]|nr:ATP-binding cassette domain-containing protein [Paracoccaceae bacterium]